MSSSRPNRRCFFRDIGSGMLAASVGMHVASDLGIAEAAREDDGDPLAFGDWEPLVRFMEDTPLDRLQQLVVEKLRAGISAKRLIGAAALANARACGGEDFDAYHSMMALVPAFEMRKELPDQQKPLPILKVLYRNAKYVQKFASVESARLQNTFPAASHSEQNSEVRLKQAIRAGDMDEAERIFALTRSQELDAAYNQLLTAIEDHANVHRIVLTHRSWSLKDLVGEELSETLLRQSVRFCVLVEQRRAARGQAPLPISGLLPKLLDEYGLIGRSLGTRTPEDDWVLRFSDTVFSSSQSGAAEAVAAALAEGFSLESVGEAISLAANQRVLRDPGRRKALPEKPVGSVHGGSEGIHASDATNAWRNVARVSNARNAVASLIVAAYYASDESFYEAADGPMNARAFPLPEHLEKVQTTDAGKLLAELDTAIRANDQLRACAVTQRYGELGYAPRPMFDLLLRYAVSCDGALHAEKYYRTVTEEFASTRPAFRWRHVVGLARVTASQHGFPAEGYEEARELLHLG